MGSTGGETETDAESETETDAEDETETGTEGETETGTEGETERAETAKSRAVAATDGDPECVLCASVADYFLFEAGRVEQFVCWEHVSPHSAAVEGDLEETPAGRPVALEL